MTATAATSTIGTITPRGQVHLAHGTNEQYILCRFPPFADPTTNTIAAIPDDTDVCHTLQGAEVKLSKLCRHCFSVSVRKRYREQLAGQ